LLEFAIIMNLISTCSFDVEVFGEVYVYISKMIYSQDNDCEN